MQPLHKVTLRYSSIQVSNQLTKSTSTSLLDAVAWYDSTWNSNIFSDEMYTSIETNKMWAHLKLN